MEKKLQFSIKTIWVFLHILHKADLFINQIWTNISKQVQNYKNSH